MPRSGSTGRSSGISTFVRSSSISKRFSPLVFSDFSDIDPQPPSHCGRSPTALPHARSINVLYEVRADKLAHLVKNIVTPRVSRHLRGNSLPKLQFEKVFTVEEANALIPRMELLVRAMQVEADAIRARLREVMRDDDAAVTAMPLSEVIERFPELKENAERMAEV